MLSTRVRLVPDKDVHVQLGMLSCLDARCQSLRFPWENNDGLLAVLGLAGQCHLWQSICQQFMFLHERNIVLTEI